MKGLSSEQDVAVWCKEALHVDTSQPDPVLFPLYFCNHRKQLFCFRNCYAQGAASSIVRALQTIPYYRLYCYSGSEGDTYVAHTCMGIDEAADHRPLYDYNGTPEGVRELSAQLYCAIRAAFSNTGSRKQYTSVLFRSSVTWGAADCSYANTLGPWVEGCLRGHVISVTLSKRGSPMGTVMHDLSWGFPGRAAGLHTDGWHALAVYPNHQTFLHPDLVAKTISSDGNCLYSALLYTLAKLWYAHSDIITGNPALLRLYKGISSTGGAVRACQFLRQFINATLTPAFLCQYFCNGDQSAFVSFVEDGSLLLSGVVDAEADRRFMCKVSSYAYEEQLQAIRVYRDSASYWGRDFDLQLFERATGVGVVVFASRSFFGKVVDILGRKPNEAREYYVTLYNKDNIHFEVAAVGPRHVCGFRYSALPPWLKSILDISLCCDVSTWRASPIYF